MESRKETMIPNMMKPDSVKIEPTEIRDEFVELRSTYFQPLHQRMKRANKLKDITFIITDYSYNPELAFQMTKRSKEVLERKFNELLIKFFAMSLEPARNLELVTKTGVDLKALNISIRRLKKYVDVLNHRLDFLERKLDKARLLYSYKSFHTALVHTDQRNSDHEIGSNRLAASLSKKLAIIQFYVIRESVSTSSLEDSSKRSSGFSGTNGEFEEGEGSAFKREDQEVEDYNFVVKTFTELKKKIAEVMAEKRKKVQIARKDRRKSFMEWLKECDEPLEAEYWKTIHQIKDAAMEVGILLSLALSDFLFLASQSQNAMKKYQKHFKAIVKSLLVHEEKNSMAIEKISSVLELAEWELVKIGKLSHELDDWKSIDDDDDQNEMSFLEAETDQFLDIFLANVVWLESVLSRPVSLPESGNILLNEELMNLEKILQEGKENVEDATLMVQSLRTTQCDQLTQEDVPAARFQKVMATKIAEIWGGFTIEEMNQIYNLGI